MYIHTKCSNYASESCPCALAEYGHCIVCSMCRGEDFCDCGDAAGYCILQELRNNSGKAKEQNKILSCEAVFVRNYGDEYKYIRLNVPSRDISQFKRFGAFVFVRTSENPFYDVPISVIYEDYDSDSIGMFIQLRGIKTKTFANIEKGDRIFLRGPYYNGLQGIKKVMSLKGKKALVLCRGIGLLPSLHVIGKLRENHNDLDVCFDPGQFDKRYIDFVTDLFEIDVRPVAVCDGEGNLTPGISDLIQESVANGTKLIHLGLSDWLIKKCACHLEKKYGRSIALSCINNTHMCCGEGICGACTKNIDSGKIVHLCKEQMDVYDYKNLL